MAKKKQYPAINLGFPEGTDTQEVKDYLADLAKELGYVANYHKTVDRGSIGLMLLAIVKGDATVIKLDK